MISERTYQIWSGPQTRPAAFVADFDRLSEALAFFRAEARRSTHVPDVARLARWRLLDTSVAGKQGQQLNDDARDLFDLADGEAAPPSALLATAAELVEAVEAAATDIQVEHRMVCHPRGAEGPEEICDECGRWNQVLRALRTLRRSGIGDYAARA